MEVTQSFRLIGKVDTKEIHCGLVDGQYIVRWNDVEHEFPGVKHVRNGDVAISLMTDSNGRIVPAHIKCCPGVILDVVLSNTVEHDPVDSPMATSSLAPADGRADTPTHAPIHRGFGGAIINELKMSPQLSSTATLAESVSEFAIVAEPFTDLSSTEPRQATVTQPEPGFQSTVVQMLGALYGQGATTQQIAQEIWELQKQMNDRLVLIQSKTEAILTQNLWRTHQASGGYLGTRKQYFSRTAPSNACKIYVVNKPTEFKKYGPFLMVMLDMIKNGTGIVGSVVPAVAAIDKVTSKGIDYSLKYLKENHDLINKSDGVIIDDDARAVREDLANYLAGVEALEGADLRQLGSYLAANRSENLRGNMYRMTTKDGHENGTAATTNEPTIKRSTLRSSVMWSSWHAENLMINWEGSQ
ncbi:hypothetical protein BG000_009455 [Podila horticola]|nr:hypothetical protein BG000_009455 [Podila horticola]